MKEKKTVAASRHGAVAEIELGNSFGGGFESASSAGRCSLDASTQSESKAKWRLPSGLAR